MSSVLSACLLSLLAGLCTGLGGLVTVVKKPDQRQVAFLMGLTAGVMITLSFVELVNEAWQASGYLVTTIGFGLGALFMLSIDWVTPHIRFGEEETSPLDGKLLKAGWLVAIGITIHNIPEGIAVGAVLARYYPAALHVFHDFASPIALLFLLAFPTPAAVVSVTRSTFGQWARAHRYRQSDAVLSAAYARLQAAYPVASATTVAAYWEEAVWLAQHLLATIEHKKREIVRLQELFQQHPDHELFASLPGTGDFLAPALLAKFGDDRERFPDPRSVQCLAGTCPVTEQSGKGRRVHSSKSGRIPRGLPRSAFESF